MTDEVNINMKTCVLKDKKLMEIFKNDFCSFHCIFYFIEIKCGLCPIATHSH